MTLDMSKNEITDHEYTKQEILIRQEILSKFLQAMREDLAEWISSLSFHVTVSPNHFMKSLENGIILCQHARLIQRYAEEYVVVNPGQNIRIPTKEVYYTEKAAFPRSFIARDNVANFIYWCRELGIPNVVLFETEDLVLGKNEKSVILTLLDVARLAYKFGVQPPEIVRFEKEIDDEIEQDKENEKLGRPPPKPRDLEEDNNLDTMVRNIVNKCACYDRFPIKKLAEGKYKLGKKDTIIFVRIMRKHVMVRIGGGWDTLEHFITKHDPCRMKIAGNIESNGHVTTPINSQSSLRRKSLTRKDPMKSNDVYSSDNWSMCSGSSDGSGSMESPRADWSCEQTSRRKLFQRKNSNISSGSTATDDTSGNSDVAISFVKSIEEIDQKLKILEDIKPAIDLTIKDTAVYDNKGDRWLRTHMNSIKQRRMTVDQGNDSMNPMEQFSMRRGYTADIIKRDKENKKLERNSDLNQREFDQVSDEQHGSKTAGTILSGSLDQGLNSNQGYRSLPRPRRKSKGDGMVLRRGKSPNYDLLSNSSQSSSPDPMRKSYSDISTQTIGTQTDSVNDNRLSGMPRALKNRVESSGGSRIPRPKLHRSNTMDGTSRRKRNLNVTESERSPSSSFRREKSDVMDARMVRREKSDLTGRRSKSKTTSQASRKSDIAKNEKAVRIRNGAVLNVHG